MVGDPIATTAGIQPRHGHLYYENRRSFGSRFRLARFQKRLLPLIVRIAQTQSRIRILDLGGARNYWWPLWDSSVGHRCEVTVSNLNKSRADITGHGERVSFMAGDARRMDLPDNSFDLVHSNSMIEHVGHWNDMVDAAREIQRLAPHHYVQTPNFGFVVEPHYRLPFIHWLPEQVRAEVVLSLKRRSSFGEAMELVQSYQLLNQRQMSALFPDSHIVPERFMGFTKSLIAISR